MNEGKAADIFHVTVKAPPFKEAAVSGQNAEIFLDQTQLGPLLTRSRML